MFKIEIVRNNKNQEPEPQQEIEKSPETVLQELRYKRMELLTEYRSTKADLVKNGPHPKSAAGMEVLDPIIEKLAQTSCQIGEVRDKNNITFNPLKYYLDKTERLKEVRKWTEGEFINTEIGKEIHEVCMKRNWQQRNQYVLREKLPAWVEDENRHSHPLHKTFLMLWSKLREKKNQEKIDTFKAEMDETYNKLRELNQTPEVVAHYKELDEISRVEMLVDQVYGHYLVEYFNNGKTREEFEKDTNNNEAEEDGVEIEKEKKQ